MSLKDKYSRAPSLRGPLTFLSFTRYAPSHSQGEDQRIICLDALTKACSQMRLFYQSLAELEFHKSLTNYHGGREIPNPMSL